MRQAEHREAFGTLRSILDRPLEDESWTQVCACLEVLAGSEEFEAVVVPYCQRAVAQRASAWAGVRRSPQRWQRALMAGDRVPAFALVDTPDPGVPFETFAQLAAFWGSAFVHLSADALGDALPRSFEQVTAACGAPVACFEWALGAAPEVGDAAAHEAMMARLETLAAAPEPVSAARSSWADLDRALVGFLAQWLLVPFAEARVHREVFVQRWRQLIQARARGEVARACFVAWPGQPRAALIWVQRDEARALYAAPRAISPLRLT